MELCIKHPEGVKYLDEKQRPKSMKNSLVSPLVSLPCSPTNWTYAKIHPLLLYHTPHHTSKDLTIILLLGLNDSFDILLRVSFSKKSSSRLTTMSNTSPVNSVRFNIETTSVYSRHYNSLSRLCICTHTRMHMHTRTHTHTHTHTHYELGGLCILISYVAHWKLYLISQTCQKALHGHYLQKMFGALLLGYYIVIRYHSILSGLRFSECELISIAVWIMASSIAFKSEVFD